MTTMENHKLTLCVVKLIWDAVKSGIYIFHPPPPGKYNFKTFGKKNMMEEKGKKANKGEKGKKRVKKLIRGRIMTESDN